MKINDIYSGGTPTSDKAAAALKEGWDKAGFSTSLQPETQNDDPIVQNPAKQNKAWGDIDEMLAKDVAYIPITVTTFFLIHGSGVTNWIDNPAVADAPDLGSLGTTAGR